MTLINRVLSELTLDAGNKLKEAQHQWELGVRYSVYDIWNVNTLYRLEVEESESRATLWAHQDIDAEAEAISTDPHGSKRVEWGDISGATPATAHYAVVDAAVFSPPHPNGMVGGNRSAVPCAGILFRAGTAQYPELYFSYMWFQPAQDTPWSDLHHWVCSTNTTTTNPRTRFIKNVGTSTEATLIWVGPLYNEAFPTDEVFVLMAIDTEVRLYKMTASAITLIDSETDFLVSSKHVSRAQQISQDQILWYAYLQSDPNVMTGITTDPDATDPFISYAFMYDLALPTLTTPNPNVQGLAYIFDSGGGFTYTNIFAWSYDGLAVKAQQGTTVVFNKLLYSATDNTQMLCISRNAISGQEPRKIFYHGAWILATRDDIETIDYDIDFTVIAVSPRPLIAGVYVEANAQEYVFESGKIFEFSDEDLAGFPLEFIHTIYKGRQLQTMSDSRLPLSMNLYKNDAPVFLGVLSKQKWNGGQYQGQYVELAEYDLKLRISANYVTTDLDVIANDTVDEMTFVNKIQAFTSTKTNTMYFKNDPIHDVFRILDMHEGYVFSWSPRYKARWEAMSDKGVSFNDATDAFGPISMDIFDLPTTAVILEGGIVNGVRLVSASETNRSQGVYRDRMPAIRNQADLDTLRIAMESEVIEYNEIDFQVITDALPEPGDLITLTLSEYDITAQTYYVQFVKFKHTDADKEILQIKATSVFLNEAARSSKRPPTEQNRQAITNLEQDVVQTHEEMSESKSDITVIEGDITSIDSDIEELMFLAKDVLYGYFPALYNFKDDAVGSVPAGWTDTLGNMDKFIISEHEGHKNVLALTNTENTNNQVQTTFTAVSTLSTEFYMASSSVGTNWVSYGVRDSSENLAGNIIIIANGIRVYYDDPAANIVLSAATDNTIYHIRMDFDCVAETFDVYLNGVLEASDLAFRNSMAAIDRFDMNIKAQSSGSLTGYLDAADFSWAEGYFVNRNYPTLLAWIKRELS